MIDKYIKECLDKILAPKPVVSTGPIKNLVIALPKLGKLSLQIRTRINRIMLKGKRVKGDDDSAIKEHLLFCNHIPNLKISQFLQPTTMALKSR